MQRESHADGESAFHPATATLREILDLTARFESHLGSELDVNRTDLKAMEHLIANGPLTPTELARRLDVSTAAVTAIVDRLTAVGHVGREPNPADRRGILVIPNPRSVGRAMGILLPMIEGIDGVLDEFGVAEQATITRYLAGVAEVYRAQLPEDPA